MNAADFILLLLLALGDLCMLAYWRRIRARRIRAERMIRSLRFALQWGNA
jgi:hypothetical protein